MNLLTQFGLGLGILAAGDGQDGRTPQYRQGALILCISLFALWLFFTYVIAPLGLDFYWYVLLYPLSALTVRGIQGLLGSREALKILRSAGEFPRAAAPLPPGWVEFLSLGLLISLHLALGPLEALFLSLCFSLGLALSLGILREIDRRSRFEAVPPFLRGCPLALISLGLLSLIFTSASLMFFSLGP
jgi:electron transport complex protein RnfA